jgi:hypothetical protein
MDRKYTHRLAFANGKRFFVRNSKASQGDHRERLRSTGPSNLNKINVLGRVAGAETLLAWECKALHRRDHMLYSDQVAEAKLGDS